MRTVFVADAHLRAPDDHNYRLLLEFFDGLKGNTDTLVILGDLFEFWIGYRELPFPQYRPVLDKLEELRRAGIRLIYFEGNHDFHMGPLFTESLQATVHPGPATMTLGGEHVFLCHGDEMNHRDYGYRLLRFVLHSRLVRLLTAVVPARVASAIAERMGRRSRRRHGHRRLRWDYRAIMRQFAAARFADGFSAVVTGHFHAPLLERSGNPERLLLCVGDWQNHFSFAEWRDGEWFLSTYTP